MRQKKNISIIVKAALVTLSAITIPSVSCVADNSQGQRVAVKTNLLSDAFTDINLGAELALGRKWSLDISGDYNGWKLSDSRQWKHWLVIPEGRYWRNHAFHGSFFPLHLIGGEYNVIHSHSRYQGHVLGAGIGYGYALDFARHWSLEAEVAVGYARYFSEKYPCASCGRLLTSGHHNYVGPTKAAINLIYRFGGRKKAPVVVPDTVEPVVIMPIEIPEQKKMTLGDFGFPLVEAPTVGYRTYASEGSASLRFPVNDTIIDPEVGLNRSEIAKIVATVDSIKSRPGIRITNMELQGVASPEGSWENNVRLSHGRVNALRNYLATLHEFDYPADSIRIDYIPEDWEGFRKLMLETQLPHKDAIIALIDNPEMAPDAKESVMRKKYPSDFTTIKQEIFPLLRRSNYRINYVRVYEVEETSALHEVNELIRNNRTEEAAARLETLPQSPEADYTRGVIEALREHPEEAEKWFRKALDQGIEEANTALEILGRTSVQGTLGKGNE